MRRLKKGVSLISLIITIVVIIVLATITIYNSLKTVEQSQQVKSEKEFINNPIWIKYYNERSL